MLLYRQTLRTGDDVFAARQRGRAIAGLLGFDEADQVRLATALSEVGRDAVAGGHTADRSFEVSVESDQLTIVVAGFDDAAQADGVGAVAARRLMTSVAIDHSPAGARVVMQRRLPRPMTGDDLATTRHRIETTVVATPLDELRSQNRELVDTLEALNARQVELQRLNEELEETNRGVMAMYTQLSDELDSTNRGVVALYAELDDKSRQLQLASESKSRFLSSVSHELRSPVTTIVGLTGLLADASGIVADMESRRQVALIRQLADELLELVSQLLDLSKAEAGRLDPHVVSADIRPVVRSVLRALAPSVKPGVHLRDALGDEPLVAEVDVDLFRQVVRNVVANAVAFTERGSVVVSARHADGPSVVLDVVDTGVGISDENLDRIFEEFFQVRGPLQPGRRGTGLGLPYSRKVVEALGGTLTATSASGTGSTFTIELRRSST